MRELGLDVEGLNTPEKGEVTNEVAANSAANEPFAAITALTGSAGDQLGQASYQMGERILRNLVCVHCAISAGVLLTWHIHAPFLLKEPIARDPGSKGVFFALLWTDATGAIRERGCTGTSVIAVLPDVPAR